MAEVAVCIPHAEKVKPQFYRAFFQMQNNFRQHAFVFCEIDMTIIGKARNELVHTARQGKPEVLWFLDDDVIVPPHAGVLIDQALELNIVSGLYFNRRPPFTPQFYTKASELPGTGMSQLYWPALEYPPGLAPYDAVGGGCLAVKAEVFKVLEERHLEDRKYIERVTHDLGADMGHPSYVYEAATLLEDYPNLSPWFEFLDKKGEDLYFCEKAKAAGYTVWGNSDVKCQHLAEIPIEEAHFLHLKNSGQLQKVTV